MAEAYDYMKDLGPAAAEGPGAVYLALRAKAADFAGRFGLDKLCGIAAGATYVAYTIAMLLRDGRVPAPARTKLAIAAVYFALPLDILPGHLDDVWVGLVALTETLSSVDARVVAEYWPGELADLYKAKAVLDNLNGRFGAGAVRRLAAKLTARG